VGASILLGVVGELEALPENIAMAFGRTITSQPRPPARWQTAVCALNFLRIIFRAV